MSYGCEIHFKNIPSDEVYGFLQTLKKAVLEKSDDIAKDNFLWLPSIRDSHIYTDTPEHIVKKIDSSWVHDVFKFRFFYLPRCELLGVFSVPSGFKEMFDNVTYFQDSCDQDYEFNEWKGVPLFEEIAYKWEHVLSDKDVLELYKKRHGDITEEESADFDYEYERKSLCYDEIWSHFSKFLYNDSSCVYLSLLGGYELREVYNFISECKKHYEEWLKEIENDKALQEKVANIKAAMDAKDADKKN